MSSLRSNNGPRIKYTPQESPYEAITVDKLTPIIGAEIGNVDLRDPSNHQMDEIHRALAENLVIFFRDQHLTQDQHLDFGRKFGELHIHPAAPTEPGHPELMIIHADKDSFARQWRGLALGRVVRPDAADGQHPLHQEMPAARRRHPVRQHVRGLRGAVGPDEDLSRRPHRAARRRALPRPVRQLRGQRQGDLPPRRPSGRAHPSGDWQEGLYVNNGFTRYINGIPRDESDGILRYLYEHMANPLFQCRFRWRENSIAFWDNRCVQHHAMWDYWPHTRSGFRVTVLGDKPY